MEIRRRKLENKASVIGDILDGRQLSTFYHYHRGFVDVVNNSRGAIRQRVS
jgi:hypothetical protein